MRILILLLVSLISLTSYSLTIRNIYEDTPAVYTDNIAESCPDRVYTSELNLNEHPNGSQRFNTTVSQNRINLNIIGYGEFVPGYLSYERLNKSGSIGIEIPLNLYIDFKNKVDPFKGFTSGINLKFYTRKEAKRFFWGPCVGVGIAEWYSYYNVVNGPFITKYTVKSYDFTTTCGARVGWQGQVSDFFGVYFAGYTGLLTNFKWVSYSYYLDLGVNFSF